MGPKTVEKNLKKVKQYIETPDEQSKRIPFEVLMDEQFSDGCIGGYTLYRENLILINKECKGLLKLLALLHEAGHWLSYNYEVTYDAETNTLEQREQWAYEWGWYLNKKLELKITREEWNLIHEGMIEKGIIKKLP